MTYHIEHRTPKKGDLYIITGGGPTPSVFTARYDWREAEADVLVPDAPAWPDKSVIVIEEGMRAGETLTKEIIAIREAGTRDYLDEYGNVWIANADVITAWHEHAPDGYARVTAGKLPATAVTGTMRLVAPRREYTADELDNLPEGTCAWDEDGYVWQRRADSWVVAGGEAFHNPLRESVCTHLYSAPKH